MLNGITIVVDRIGVPKISGTLILHSETDEELLIKLAKAIEGIKIDFDDVDISTGPLYVKEDAVWDWSDDVEEPVE